MYNLLHALTPPEGLIEKDMTFEQIAAITIILLTLISIWLIPTIVLYIKNNKNDKDKKE